MQSVMWSVSGTICVHDVVMLQQAENWWIGVAHFRLGKFSRICQIYENILY